MGRSILFAAVIGVAAAWLGGCTQQINTVSDPFIGGKAELPPAALPAGVAEGVSFRLSVLLLDKNTVERIPANWDVPLQAQTREIRGTPDIIAAHPETTGVTLRAVQADQAVIADLVKAAQSDRTSVTVTSPQIAIANGKPGRIAMVETRNYVKDFKQDSSVVIGGLTATSTIYTIEKLETGLTIELTPTIEEKGVFVRLAPKMSRLEGIDTFTVAPENKQGTPFVQLPKISLAEFSANATIADGKSLLIVGPKIIGEAEVEQRTQPFAGIPPLARLFTNRSYVRDERTLVLVLVPTKVSATPAADASVIRKERVAALIGEARKSYEVQRFEEAQDLLREATLIDPQDESAALFLRLLNTKIVDRDYAAIMARSPGDPLRQKINETLIPYADMMVYPDTGGSPANRAAVARLNENVKEFVADNQELETTINFLRDNMGGNIFVNWQALTKAGVDRKTKVSVNLHNVPFSKAINAVLASAAGGKVALDYTIDEGIVTISTKDDVNASKYQVVRVFDVRPIIDARMKAAGQVAAADPAEAAAQRRAVAKDIIEEIENHIAPTSWRSAGGAAGHIREFNGQLIVTQSAGVHIEIAQRLEEERKAKNLPAGGDPAQKTLK